MKVNDLRVGNFIYSDIVNEVGEDSAELIKVDADLIWNLERSYTGRSQDIFGIPLNEEWLNKFGFYRENEGFDIWKHKYFGPFRILLENIIDHWQVGYSGGRVFRRIKYVHELQNIYFALTGFELEIQLIDFDQVDL